MEVTQSSIMNIALVDAKLRKEAWNNTFWAKYAGFVDVSKDDNGNPMYKPSGKPIEMLKAYMEQGRDNMLIPMLRYLTGEPVFGDTVLKGTGEEMSLRWLRTYVNQVRHAVTQRSGQMSEQRAKIYKLYDKARPLLADWFSKYENHNVFRTFYEGVSRELSKATGYDGLGLVKRLHPNWYYTSSTTAITTVGTAKQVKAASELDTAVTAVAGGGTPIRLQVAQLHKLRSLCMTLKIPQIVTKNGYKFWMLICHPDQVSNLKSDSAYTGAVRAAFNGKMREEPELQGVVDVIEGFAIFEDIVGIRGFNTTNDDFFGSTFATAIEADTVGTNLNAIVVGNQAIGKGIAEDLRFTSEIDDHENVKEIGGAMISGYNRADYFAEADGGEVAGDAFYKGLATETIITGVSAINQSSLILMTYA
uniref:Capsid protein n=1 Tax=viral metagenome TaxID=1070528 RepID=A0A6M3KVM8_9ZZZZ